MVNFLVRMRFAADDHQQVTDIVRELAPASRAEPGCLTYIAHWVEDDPNTLVIYEQYQDKAAHEAHRASAHFKKYAVGGLYQLMRERSFENLTAII